MPRRIRHGFRSFSARYRQRYGQDPVRTATLAYDAVALVAALVKTQGPQRFSEQVLTNPSGFAGIDGVFRFRTDGTNERGLAVMRVSPTGGQVVSPPPRAFGASGLTLNLFGGDQLFDRLEAVVRGVAASGGGLAGEQDQMMREQHRRDQILDLAAHQPLGKANFQNTRR